MSSFHQKNPVSLSNNLPIVMFAQWLWSRKFILFMVTVWLVGIHGLPRLYATLWALAGLVVFLVFHYRGFQAARILSRQLERSREQPLYFSPQALWVDGVFLEKLSRWMFERQAGFDQVQHDLHQARLERLAMVHHEEYLRVLLSATEASVLVDHTLDFLSRVWFQHQGLALYRCHPQKGLLECQMARGGDFAMHIPWWNEASCLPASCLEQRRRQSPEGRDSWEPWLAIWVEGRIWGYFVIQGGIWLGEDSDVHMILSWFELALTRLVARAREKNWAHRDALTGLWNRRYMAEYFPTELKKAFRYHYPVSCLLLDIDHFKRLNDEHGHEAGDHALQALGDYLRRTLRESDVAVRLGGEEILVILPHAGIQQAYGVAEKLREGLSGYIQRPSGESLTVSIGIASTQMGLKTEKEIVSRADAALYMAKRGGRNQTIIGQAPSVWPANDSDTHEDPTQGVTLNS